MSEYKKSRHIQDLQEKHKRAYLSELPQKSTLIGHGGYEKVPKQKRPEWATYVNKIVKGIKFTEKQRQQALNAYKLALFKEAEKVKAEQDKYKTVKTRLVSFEFKDKHKPKRQQVESSDRTKKPCIQKEDFSLYLNGELLIMDFRGQQYTYKRGNNGMIKRLHTTLSQFIIQVSRSSVPLSKCNLVHEILEMYKKTGTNDISYKRQKLIGR